MLALIFALMMVPGIPVATAVAYCRNHPKPSGAQAPTVLDVAVLPGWEPRS